LPSSAGMHVTAQVTPGAELDVASVVRRANAAGVVVRAVAPFYVDTPTRDGIMLGYGATPTHQIDAGLGHLATALDAATTGPPGPNEAATSGDTQRRVSFK